MNRSQDIMAALADSGLTSGQLVLVMQLAAAVAAEAAAGPEETPEERKKRISRETSARYRASLRVTDASPDVTDDVVTERHSVSPGDTSTSPLVRVEDNLLTKIITGNTLSLAEVRERAGDALASMATHPGIATLAPLNGLLGGIVPCLPDEIYDAVGRAAAWFRGRGPPGQMKSWTLVVKLALEARDARINGPPAPKAPHERPDTPSSKRAAREDNLSRSLAGFDAVAGDGKLIALRS